MSSASSLSPLLTGTLVVTTEENKSLRGEWEEDTLKMRVWGIAGQIVGHSDSHGLCYDVEHTDGTRASYDSTEFDVVERVPVKIVVTKRQSDYHVCVDGQPGIWACGRTTNEAIGNLISHHSEVFGITIDETALQPR
ncbi:hypothetical protein HOI18_02840 [Candidatus Uhrbacteria bacterium]|jgi:hypothetical protein|nr:hypothetical protein [Candidatus Uhrbacteria bacterium]